MSKTFAIPNGPEKVTFCSTDFTKLFSVRRKTVTAEMVTVQTVTSLMVTKTTTVTEKMTTNPPTSLPAIILINVAIMLILSMEGNIQVEKSANVTRVTRYGSKINID